MIPSQFRSNLRFALRKESKSDRQESPENRVEWIGNLLSWVAYEFKDLFFRTIKDPRFVTVVLTLFMMILNSLIFYPEQTWGYLGKGGSWVIQHINWAYVRFALWLISEITIVGIGLRAFGRFSNRVLLQQYFPTS